MRLRYDVALLAGALALFVVLACAKGAGNDSAGFEPRPSNQPSNVYVYHDDTRAVTCWLAYESISCLSDKDFEP